MSLYMKQNKFTDQDSEAFRSALLQWYDVHRRALPWRAKEGQEPNPYHVWLSEIMLQQTTVPAVIPYFKKFVDKWPAISNLAAADQDDVMDAWAGLGYYARARNLLKCAKVVANDMGGTFPQDQKLLKALPGVGDYTSAAIRSIAFDKPANVVDGNVERVMTRLFAIKDPLPNSKPELKALAGSIADDYGERPGDYAQALMDLGATICTPKSPKCMICPVRSFCRAQEEGIADALPYKVKKGQKPARQGYVYWIINRRAGDILLHKRPEKGLLGGMTGLPTSDWVDIKKGVPDHPDGMKALEYEVRKSAFIMHSFTHFDLKLTGCFIDCEHIPFSCNKTDYFWLPISNLPNQSFPTVFKKFVTLML